VASAHRYGQVVGSILTDATINMRVREFDGLDQGIITEGG